ncbi:MAG: patatin-like phospholipase family protein [Chitinophagaceae bacterium]
METQLKGFKQFIAESRVDEDVVNPIIDVLKAREKERTGIERMPVFSDLVKTEDDKEYQYVNYVQEGGGVLGVALVGYTYVLEKLGIRFLKLAGTSAGAINTMMLAAVDRKNYATAEKELNETFTTQSEIILFELLNFRLWDLVDGSRFGKWLIGSAIKASNHLKRFFKVLLFCLVFGLFSSLFFGILNMVEPSADGFWEGLRITVKLASIVAISSVLLLTFVMLITNYYLRRFAKASYGINPGKAFHQWMKDVLQRNDISNNQEMDAKIAERCVGLRLSKARLEKNYPGDNSAVISPYLTIIASDITNQTKVEFPLMAKEYWAEPDKVSPADFVRASMSIPVFFEPFKVDVTQVLQRKNTDTTMKAFTDSQRSVEKKEVQFVDGGILSNFPINVFHNPKIEWARMPTFGVKLEDKAHEKTDEKTTAMKKPKSSLLPFLGSILSTIRFYYDRDFLKRNMVYETCIAHIDVEGINWLDFGLDEATQKKLFLQGARAAKTFFLGSELGGNFWMDGKEKPFKAYDWETFKEERRKVVLGG